MIIIGYQGIGKSTLTARKRGYIDLESSCFWHNGERPKEWHIYYCQIAEDLSRQGYKVFTSSHEVVRQFLKDSKEDVLIVCPSTELKDEWIAKLKDRYDDNKSDKNYKAWKNAEDRYADNINELKDSGIPYVELTDIKYDLENVIYEYLSNMPFK